MLLVTEILVQVDALAAIADNEDEKDENQLPHCTHEKDSVTILNGNHVT